ncbi:MAG: RNase adaptor protein RapZ [bacterium TMED88]|nr:RNase adapter RapZ [Deltaproteobacteria bacterium]OUV36173.1 MAG: RNase adaptor protein RapZ [bacterium TMED88]
MTGSNSRQHVIFVAGLSGSGKTTAMAALEDLGFYGVDNLPAQLVPQFLKLCGETTPPIEKVALAVDAREEQFLRSVPEVVETLRKSGAWIELIFLDSSDEALLNRYRETRRVHPLSPEGSVGAGIARERELLISAVSMADLRVDTSAMNVHQLKSRITDHVRGESRPTVVNLVSFGFRYGPPRSAELLFDMRFLPNPYFESDLRSQTGREAPVADYVLNSEGGEEMTRRLRDFVGYVLPEYDREGKAYVTVAIGCTGGRHRSVAVAEDLSRYLKAKGREVNLVHRDVERLS